jgi:hypothetical protein
MKLLGVAAAAAISLAMAGLGAPLTHADPFAACNALPTPTDRGYCMDKILAGGQAPAGPPAAALPPAAPAAAPAPAPAPAAPPENVVYPGLIPQPYEQAPAPGWYDPLVSSPCNPINGSPTCSFSNPNSLPIAPPDNAPPPDQGPPSASNQPADQGPPPEPKGGPYCYVVDSC